MVTSWLDTQTILQLTIELGSVLVLFGVTWGSFKVKHDIAITQLDAVETRLEKQSVQISELHHHYVSHKQLYQVVSQLKIEHDRLRADIHELRGDTKEILRIVAKHT